MVKSVLLRWTSSLNYRSKLKGEYTHDKSGSGTSVGPDLNPHSLSLKTFLVTLSLKRRKNVGSTVGAGAKEISKDRSRSRPKKDRLRNIDLTPLGYKIFLIWDWTSLMRIRLCYIDSGSVLGSICNRIHEISYIAVRADPDPDSLKWRDQKCVK